MSPEDLMSFIECGAKDVHWTPQHNLLGKYKRKATLIPCEELTQWWFDRGYGDLGVFNSTDGDVELSHSLLTRVEEFYRNDISLYKKAITTYDVIGRNDLPERH